MTTTTHNAIDHHSMNTTNTMIHPTPFLSSPQVYSFVPSGFGTTPVSIWNTPFACTSLTGNNSSACENTKFEQHKRRHHPSQQQQQQQRPSVMELATYNRVASTCRTTTTSSTTTRPWKFGDAKRFRLSLYYLEEENEDDVSVSPLPIQGRRQPISWSQAASVHSNMAPAPEITSATIPNIQSPTCTNNHNTPTTLCNVPTQDESQHNGEAVYCHYYPIPTSHPSCHQQVGCVATNNTWPDCYYSQQQQQQQQPSPYFQSLALLDAGVMMTTLGTNDDRTDHPTSPAAAAATVVTPWSDLEKDCDDDAHELTWDCPSEDGHDSSILGHTVVGDDDDQDDTVKLVPLDSQTGGVYHNDDDDSVNHFLRDVIGSSSCDEEQDQHSYAATKLMCYSMTNLPTHPEPVSASLLALLPLFLEDQDWMLGQE
jgi:hypothetical protein